MSSLHYDSVDPSFGTPANAQHVFLEGDFIVVPHDFAFPRICLVTGQEVGDPPLTRTFRQSTSAVVGVGAHGLMALLLAQGLRHKARITFSLSREVIRRRFHLRVLSFVVPLLGIALGVGLGNALDNGWPLLLLPVSIVAGMGFSWWRDRYLRVARVTSSCVWLAGVNADVRQAIYAAGCKENA